jgi:hypothetical protein
MTDSIVVIAVQTIKEIVLYVTSGKTLNRDGSAL